MVTIASPGPRRLFLLAAFLVSVTAPAMLPAGPAVAASQAPTPSPTPTATVTPFSGGGDGCNPGRANNYLTYYWAGAQSEIVNGIPGGVYANIRVYSPFVAGPNQGAPSNDTVSEWVMLGNNEVANSDEWSQVGWIEMPGGVRNTFVQYASGANNVHTDYFSPDAINSTQTYKALYQPGSQTPFVLIENGVTLVAVNLSWTPNVALIDAEIHTQASQMPGGTADPAGQIAAVSNAHVWPTAGTGSWQNFDGITQILTSPAANTSFIGLSPLNAENVNSWRTWDKACTT